MSCKRIIGTDFLNFILADTNYVTLRVKEKLVPILGTALCYHSRSTIPYRRTCITCFWKTKSIPEILSISHNRCFGVLSLILGFLCTRLVVLDSMTEYRPSRFELYFKSSSRFQQAFIVSFLICV